MFRLAINFPKPARVAALLDAYQGPNCRELSPNNKETPKDTVDSSLNSGGSPKRAILFLPFIDGLQKRPISPRAIPFWAVSGIDEHFPLGLRRVWAHELQDMD